MLPDLATLASLCAAPVRSAAGFVPLLAAMAFAGVAGGATHCAAMCGPLLLLRGGAQNVAGACLAARMRAGLRLPEQVGRLGGYVLLGTLAGAVGNGFTSLVRDWLPLGAALSVAAAIGFAWLAWRGRAAPAPGWITARLAALDRMGRFGRVGFGAALALLPCALLHTALLAAAATGDAVAGAAAMAAFALGTMPGLSIVTIAGRSLAPRPSLLASSVLCAVVAVRALA